MRGLIPEIDLERAARLRARAEEGADGYVDDTIDAVSAFDRLTAKVNGAHVYRLRELRIAGIGYCTVTLEDYDYET